MGEKLWASWALIAGLVLAGCAGSGGGGGDGTTTPPVEVDDSTGAIVGVVVDQGIRPLRGAMIKVLGTDLSSETDDNGNFAFSKVAPGSFIVEASHGLYDKQQQTTNVVAGDADPTLLRFQLTRLISQDPYMITLPFDGFIACSAGQEDAGYSEECGEGVGLPKTTCDIGLPPPCIDNPQGGGRVGGQGNNQVQYDFFIDNLGVKTIVVELYWTPSVQTFATGELLTVVSTNWFCDPFCGGNTFTCGAGASPMYMRADIGGEEGQGNTTAPDELRCGFINPGSASLVVNEPITAFTWANPSGRDPTNTTYTPTVVLDQPYQMFVTLSYYLPLPPCWSFVANDKDPFRPDAPTGDLCAD